MPLYQFPKDHFPRDRFLWELGKFIAIRKRQEPNSTVPSLLAEVEKLSGQKRESEGQASKLRGAYEVYVENYGFDVEGKLERFSALNMYRAYKEGLVRTQADAYQLIEQLESRKSYEAIKREWETAASREIKVDLHDTDEEHFDGGPSDRHSQVVERNQAVRTAAIDYHGTKCMVCKFDFGGFYGEHGAGYIEVHHLKPLSSIKKRTRVDPRRDVTVVCSNCHRMIHHRQDGMLSPQELRTLILKERSTAGLVEPTA